jgi:hypothetical protein
MTMISLYDESSIVSMQTAMVTFLNRSSEATFITSLEAHPTGETGGSSSTGMPIMMEGLATANMLLDSTIKYLLIPSSI